MAPLDFDSNEPGAATGALAGVLHRARELGGVLLIDLPRYLPMLWRAPDAAPAAAVSGWVGLRNRHERLIVNPAGPGVDCDWQWTSDLHACKVVPVLGIGVMRAALAEWPIHLEGATAHPDSSLPQISFVIPHRGAERLPLLMATLHSILAQRSARVECIVVEQASTEELGRLPAGVRKIHLPHSSDSEGWYKSWAYNVGVAEARAPLVVCHDGDILVPEGYAAELLKRFDDPACDVVAAQRFLFYLTQEHTATVLEQRRVSLRSPDRIVQNWKGGTLAIRREAFFRIGGFDESFEGWTGEDVEFYDRCRVLAGWRYGYLPFVHLWHTPQPTKFSEQRKANLAFTTSVMSVPREERVERLRRRQPWMIDPALKHVTPSSGQLRVGSEQRR